MSMFKSLKGQILVLSTICLVLALLVLTVANFLVARSQARDALQEESLATAKSHVETIEEWGRAKAMIVAASIGAFEDPDPVKTLAILRDAGKFSTVYFGYADKKYVFSEQRSLPPTTIPLLGPGTSRLRRPVHPSSRRPTFQLRTASWSSRLPPLSGRAVHSKAWRLGMCPWSRLWPPWRLSSPRPRVLASWPPPTARSLRIQTQR